MELQKYQRYFKTGPGEYGEGDLFMGVRMGQVFALAKEFMGMPLDEVESEICIAVRLVEAAAEVLHGPLADEVVVPQHAGDALAVD